MTSEKPLCPNDEKLRELIVYISDRCETDETFGAVKLNKILFLADFNAHLIQSEYPGRDTRFSWRKKGNSQDSDNDFEIFLHGSQITVALQASWRIQQFVHF